MVFYCGAVRIAMAVVNLYGGRKGRKMGKKKSHLAVVNTETGEIRQMSDGKFRNWTAVLYPDSMIPHWEDRIYRLLQVPFEYIIHDKDSVELEEDESQPRKTHVHIIVHYSSKGTTTYETVYKMFDDNLSSLGHRCLNKVEGVRNLKYLHQYLTHSTKDAIADGKYRYSDDAIITGNNWDLGAFIELQEMELLSLYSCLRDTIKTHKFFTVLDLEEYIERGGLRDDIDFMDSKQIIQYLSSNRNKYVQICKECYFKYRPKDDK